MAKSSLSLANRRLLYIAVLRFIWAYVYQCGVVPVTHCATSSNVFKKKVLRIITRTLLFFRNDTLYHDLHILTVCEIIAISFSGHERRLHDHSKSLALVLLDNSSTLWCLVRRHCTDLISKITFRFLYLLVPLLHCYALLPFKGSNGLRFLFYLYLLVFYACIIVANKRRFIKKIDLFFLYFLCRLIIDIL